MASNKLAVFEGKKIRRHWDDKQEKWYFSVIDVVAVLSGSNIPRRYWSDLKRKLTAEGSQVYEKIVQLKLEAHDRKYYLTDVADTETVFRITQSIPSPNAEPFKLWLARVARKGGGVAGVARKRLEKRLGKSVVSKENYLGKPQNRKLLQK